MVRDCVVAERAAAGDLHLVGRAQIDDCGEAAGHELGSVVGGDCREVVGADREALAEHAAGDGDPAEIAEVHWRAERELDGGGHVIFFLMRALPWSMAVTSTMMQMMMALRWP